MTTGVFTKTFTVLHRTSLGPGVDGRPTFSTQATSVHGAFRHRQAIDRLDAGLVVIDEWTAYLDPTATIAVGDTVVVDSDTFQVVSIPFPAVNYRTGDTHHLEVRLRKADR